MLEWSEAFRGCVSANYHMQFRSSNNDRTLPCNKCGTLRLKSSGPFGAIGLKLRGSTNRVYVCRFSLRGQTPSGRNIRSKWASGIHHLVRRNALQKQPQGPHSFHYERLRKYVASACRLYIMCESGPSIRSTAIAALSSRRHTYTVYHIAQRLQLTHETSYH